MKHVGYTASSSNILEPCKEEVGIITQVEITFGDQLSTDLRG